MHTQLKLAEPVLSGTRAAADQAILWAGPTPHVATFNEVSISGQPSFHVLARLVAICNLGPKMNVALGRCTAGVEQACGSGMQTHSAAAGMMNLPPMSFPLLHPHLNVSNIEQSAGMSVNLHVYGYGKQKKEHKTFILRNFQPQNLQRLQDLANSITQHFQ